MKKMLIALILALALTACRELEKKTATENVNSNAKTIVKIGVVTSLSGKYAENGQNVREVIEFAKEDNPSEIDFQFIFEDYGYESSRAALATSKLLNVDKVDALISWSSMAGNVVSPLADKAKKMHFSICNDDNVAKGKYNFTHFTPSEELAERWISEILPMNPKKVVLFSVYQPALQKHTDAVERLLKEKAIAVERVNFSMDNKDFALLIEEMKRKDFDVWFLCALPPSLDVFLNTFVQKEVGKPLIAIDSFLFAQNKSLVEGRRFVTTPDAKPNLLARLTEKNGSKNYFSVGYAYDVASLLITAYDDLYQQFERLPTVDEVSEYLLRVTDDDSAVGKIYVDGEGVVHSKAVVKEMKNGQPMIVGK